MNKFTYLLVIVMLFTLGFAPMNRTASEVVLDASQVTSARDIEMAIDAATAYGAHPGIVTLDGSKGKFEYTGDDRSINIYYSNITIRSFNWATIGNCDDGVFFDDLTANNIIIEGVEFVCLNGHAVYAPFLSQHHHVILRNNYFESGFYPAIAILQGDYWIITGNQILSLGTGVYLNETGGTLIRNNIIRANVGVELYNSGYDNKLTNNEITGWWQGVVLSGKTLGNTISANKFDHIQDAGIVFTDIVAGNRVTGNKIACWTGIPCAAVTADPVNYEQNKIAGNKIVKGK
jgi:nitrous oxidase accessory protein NosD